MHRWLFRGIVWVALAALPLAQGTGSTVLFEGARLIPGDASPAIERGAILVEGGRILAVGVAGSVTAPPGTRRVDLTGRTVMPAMVNVHVHIGYEGYTSWGAANHTPANVQDHLLREAFYGVAATTTVGSSPTAQMLAFQRDQQAGAYRGASRLLFMPGFAPPHGGPDHILREATDALKVVNEVTTPDEARAAVRRVAALGIGHVKAWFDDRRGSYPKLSTDTYLAIVDEAHRRKITLHTHAIDIADQKVAVKAGTDVLVHMVQRQPLDDEFLALIREKTPYWATVIGLGDPVGVCNQDPFFEQAMPDAVITKIRTTRERASLQAHCLPQPDLVVEQREKQMAINFPQMLQAGARVVLATDTGIHPGHTFGSGEHVELARWVQLGMSPAEAIVAATSRPAELMGQQDLGMLAAGKRASFIVLEANPLENILHTRRIADVYLDGLRVDREALRVRFRREAR